MKTVYIVMATGLVVIGVTGAVYRVLEVSPHPRSRRFIRWINGIRWT